MNTFSLFGHSDSRMLAGRTLVAMIVLTAACASSLLSPLRASAQMEYDFNEDNKVNCADFEEQYPDTYTDEATKALEQYPDDLSRLDGNDGVEGIACEGQPTGAASAEASDPPETLPSSSTIEPPVAETTDSADVPADVMARVEGCAVVSISSRDVVGAGCPGVGTVAFRIPDDAPSMQGTVIMSPGAAQAPAADAARESAPATRASESSQNEENSTSSGNENKGAAKESKQKDDDTKASKGKNKNNKQEGKGKKGKKSKKKNKKQRNR